MVFNFSRVYLSILWKFSGSLLYTWPGHFFVCVIVISQPIKSRKLYCKHVFQLHPSLLTWPSDGVLRRHRHSAASEGAIRRDRRWCRPCWPNYGQGVVEEGTWAQGRKLIRIRCWTTMNYNSSITNYFLQFFWTHTVIDRYSCSRGRIVLEAVH